MIFGVTKLNQRVYNLESRFMSDDNIIKAIKEGDESAIDVLYKKHFRMMAKLVIRNSGTEDAAKDIFQDALVIFWQKISSGDLVLTSKISTYLYSVCQNLWRKELVRKARESNEEVDSAVIVDYDQDERVNAIRSCVNQMGDTCKRVLSLYYFDGLSMNDIADKLGFANSNTAKTKKYKCKQELDRIVKKQYKETDFFD